MKMILVDAHCHLDCLEDIDKAIENASKAGVKVIISNGIDKENNRKVLFLAANHKIVKAALGLYPIDALLKEKEELGEKYEEFDVDSEIKFIEDNKNNIVAIGEIGLDLHNGKDEERQRKIFEKLIELAIKIDKPVIIHSRKAEAKVLDVLARSKIKPSRVVLHCFSGNKKLVAEAAKKGYNFTVPTNVVRAENFQSLVKEVDISQLLTETDSPWLSPFRDKKNEPAFVVEAVKKIAEIKNMTDEEVANNIFMNYQRIFG